MRSTVGMPRSSSSRRIIWPSIADSLDSFDETTTGRAPAACAGPAANSSIPAIMIVCRNLANAASRGGHGPRPCHGVGCRRSRQVRSAGRDRPGLSFHDPHADIRHPSGESCMKSSARAVIIGGGVVGASVLYHLARSGWSDVLLLEKSELTSGSTWHAAGGMHTFNGEANISRLQKYTIDLYREIEELSGQSCGLHPNGGLMLAATQGELDSLKLICPRARYLGMETEMITMAEAVELNPLIDPRHFIGALWRADGGHCDPSGTTHAYVKAARRLGAQVERFTRVVELRPRADG